MRETNGQIRNINGKDLRKDKNCFSCGLKMGHKCIEICGGCRVICVSCMSEAIYQEYDGDMKKIEEAMREVPAEICLKNLKNKKDE